MIINDDIKHKKYKIKFKTIKANKKIFSRKMNSFKANLIVKSIILVFILQSVSKIIQRNDYIITYNKKVNNNTFNIFGSFRAFNSYFFFNLSSIKYYFSYKFNKVELEYSLQLFDVDNNLIIPSDLALYYNLHIFCSIKKANLNLQSLSNIFLNKYFNCIEYFDLNQQAKIGIKICNDLSNCLNINLFESNYFNYNYLLSLNNYKFNSKYINKQYSLISKKVFNSNRSLYLLKKSYISNPICSSKENAITFKNIWYFKNIYNHYFCFCKGKSCPYDQNFDDCKYYFYLSIIDKNKNLYKKTDYLFLDFLYANRAPGDAYFVFREMIKQNFSAYYLTERKDIYQEYYDNRTKFQKVIPIINKQYNITGNILEQYLPLFLRLKAVISGSEFFSKENIFLNINYITFICLGHGVNYFKPFLYEEYYGCKRYNKIILPSDRIISIARQYGWKKKNIIKIGLPKWDLFYNYSLIMKKKFEKKCIFMMFTWRNLRKGKNISSHYLAFYNSLLFKIFNNIIYIIAS